MRRGSLNALSFSQRYWNMLYSYQHWRPSAPTAQESHRLSISLRQSRSAPNIGGSCLSSPMRTTFFAEQSGTTVSAKVACPASSTMAMSNTVRPVPPIPSSRTSYVPSISARQLPMPTHVAKKTFVCAFKKWDRTCGDAFSSENQSTMNFRRLSRSENSLSRRSISVPQASCLDSVSNPFASAVPPVPIIELRRFCWDSRIGATSALATSWMAVQVLLHASRRATISTDFLLSIAEHVAP